VNLVPAQYREVSVTEVPVPLEEGAVRGYLSGRPVYRRTRYVIARNGPASMVAEVGKESGQPLFSPVTSVTVLARADETALVDAPDIDTAVPTQRDRLVQRADRRRVDVLHGGELVDGDPGPHPHGQEVGALLDALAADHLRADEPQRARLGQQLDPDLLHPRVVAGSRDPLGHAHHVRDAERRGQRLTERDTADHPVPGHHPPRHADRLVPALAARRIGARDLALGVGVAARQALDGGAATDHHDLLRHQ